ncbi:LysR substrate-binding domain-containing protein [Phnomibacter sp. MR]|uniref:LysR substrate-binding domain-containing protein n=1 Tax=Phnomibacter sp. MR TaxID=3042318 RepID=UPI003A7FD962
MNLQQLEYIVAVDTHRHFVKAADSCFVTQATLSMMIKKLEEELGVKIFDRSKVPVIPTDVGKAIIDQARIVLKEAKQLEQVVQQQKGQLSGDLRIAVIPTLAPFLLPLFLPHFLAQYPQVKLHISEMNTELIIKQLESQQLDAAILATPLKRPTLNEQPLFYEQFVVYASPGSKLMKKKYVLASDIDVNKLWLLEEGHCLRNQALNLCELKKQEHEGFQLDYEAGSIETLKKLVAINEGSTIIPELALQDMPEAELDCIRFFKPPAPVREISLVTYRHFVKERLLDILRQTILESLPSTIATQPAKQQQTIAID